MNNDFSIRLGEKSQIQYHGLHTEQEFTVTLADTGTDCMTGGRIRKIARYIDGDTFLLTYGDGLIDVNIRDVVKFHQSHGRIATLTTVPPISRFGLIDLNEQNCVRSFNEKPKTDGWMNAGYFVLNRKVFDYLGGDECVFEREPLEGMARDGQLMAYRHDGFFYAMDTYREYQQLNELWNKNIAPWRVWA
jgi:glucose-1-phosphate cytidylyltransferase